MSKSAQQQTECYAVYVTNNVFGNYVTNDDDMNECEKEHSRFYSLQCVFDAIKYIVEHVDAKSEFRIEKHTVNLLD